jgi:hypothetical protein
VLFGEGVVLGPLLAALATPASSAVQATQPAPSISTRRRVCGRKRFMRKPPAQGLW